MAGAEEYGARGLCRSFERQSPRFGWGLLANLRSPGDLLPGPKHGLGQLVLIRIFQGPCGGRFELN